MKVYHNFSAESQQ